MKKIYLLLVVCLFSISSFAKDEYVKIESITPKALNAGDAITITGTYSLTHPDKGNITKFEINLNHYDGGWDANKVIYNAGSQYLLTDFTASDGTFSVTINIPADFPDKNTLNNEVGASGDLQFFQATVFYNDEATRTDFSNTPYGDLDVTNPGLPLFTSVLESNGKVYTVGSTLNIKDASAKTFEIFNLSGTVVEAGSINGSSVQIPLSLAKGIYIVKVGNTTTKISL